MKKENLSAFPMSSVLIPNDESSIVKEAENEPDDAYKLSDDEDMNSVSHIRVDKPNDCDILCGRGGLSNIHPGNSWYRNLVRINRPYYRNSPKHGKILIAKAIVNYVFAQRPPCRFLERSRKNGEDQWCTVNWKRSVDKTSQALRERENNIEDMDSPVSAKIYREDDDTTMLAQEIMRLKESFNSDNAHLPNKSQRNSEYKESGIKRNLNEIWDITNNRDAFTLNSSQEISTSYGDQGPSKSATTKSRCIRLPRSKLISIFIPDPDNIESVIEIKSTAEEPVIQVPKTDIPIATIAKIRNYVHSEKQMFCDPDPSVSSSEAELLHFLRNSKKKKQVSFLGHSSKLMPRIESQFDNPDDDDEGINSNNIFVPIKQEENERSNFWSMSSNEVNPNGLAPSESGTRRLGTLCRVCRNFRFDAHDIPETSNSSYETHPESLWSTSKPKGRRAIVAAMRHCVRAHPQWPLWNALSEVSHSFPSPPRGINVFHRALAVAATVSFERESRADKIEEFTPEKMNVYISGRLGLAEGYIQWGPWEYNQERTLKVLASSMLREYESMLHTAIHTHWEKIATLSHQGQLDLLNNLFFVPYCVDNMRENGE
jgi:hypothetical protein